MDPSSLKILQGAAGAAGAEKIGVEDVFKPYVYRGNGGANAINNGIDLSGTGGGLVWLKNRDRGTYGSHMLFDTERGSTKYILSDSDAAEATSGSGTGINTFNNNGFTLQGDGYGSNRDTEKLVSYTFKKQEKFFTICTWTGNGVQGREIPHDLNSVPGFIAVKRLDGVEDWTVYHRSVGATKHSDLNNTHQFVSDNKWDSTEPTASVFTIGAHERVNYDTWTYVAYLFADSASTSATARSVYFTGADQDSLEIASSADFGYGTGDFTWEFWTNLPSIAGTQYFMDHSTSNNGGTFHMHGNLLRYLNPTTGTGSALYDCGSLTPGEWHHIAASRSSGTTKVFVDGELRASASDTHDYPSNKVFIATRPDGQNLTGYISNFRIVKGTAVYTSAFTPPTEPLTSITNTKLLCCNNVSVTGSTTGTINNANGSPAAISESPFVNDDTAIFGPDSDQNLISCGSYVGTGSAGLQVPLPFEPQYLLIKNATDNSTYWMVFDSMRGVATSDSSFSGKSLAIYPNGNDAEDTATDYVDFTSTGFKVTIANNSEVNKSGKTHVYIAIAAETGKTMKAIETGTDVFNIDLGNGSATGPAFDANFAVDTLIQRAYASQSDCSIHLRVTGPRDLRTNTSDVEGNSVNAGAFDYMKGVSKNSSTSIWGLMWKRHAGFDCVTYGPSTGTTSMTIQHNMNAIPEMMWVKVRDDNRSWAVYHKGLNGGTNPEERWTSLDDISNGDLDSAGIWNDTPPTISTFTVGTSYPVNLPANSYRVALLFASVKGVCHVGYYTGTGSPQTITIPNGGFQPRLLIVRRMDTNNNAWYVLDTTRGWASGDDKYLTLDGNGAQGDYDFGAPTSTGFTIEGVGNTNTGKYIYYAHA